LLELAVGESLEPADSAAPQGRDWAVGLWYFGLLAISNLIWAAQGTAVKILSEPDDPAVEPLGPIGITFLPFYVTTALLVPILIWQRRRNPERARPTWSDWWRFVVAGIGGQVMAQLGMTWGVSLSLASNGAILNLLIPVLTAMLATVMLGERITGLRVACLVIGLAGAALMSVPDLEQSRLFTGSFLTGNLLILVGCCGSSFYNVYCKGLLTRFSEVEILIFSYITASLASLPLVLLAEPKNAQALQTLDARGWAAFGFLAVFMYGVSMLVFFFVLEHLSVTVASASLYLVPLFGVLIAYAVLGETLSATSLAGAAIVLISTVLVMRYDHAAS
jgi:drug/metabolite transporter (DMT)-like permease